jgi:hypothetical protein
MVLLTGSHNCLGPPEAGRGKEGPSPVAFGWECGPADASVLDVWSPEARDNKRQLFQVTPVGGPVLQQRWKLTHSTTLVHEENENGRILEREPLFARVRPWFSLHRSVAGDQEGRACGRKGFGKC